MTVLVLKNVASRGNQFVWYDVCGWDEDYGPDGGNEVHFLNCHYTGPAKPASEEQVDLVKELCPHLYTEGEVGGYESMTFISINGYLFSH